jgi:hypothetical protein
MWLACVLKTLNVVGLYGLSPPSSLFAQVIRESALRYFDVLIAHLVFRRFGRPSTLQPHYRVFTAVVSQRAQLTVPESQK